ncbi:class I adenylate-forming enzyme family protein [uncultured Mycobacterium sp.]|uniref:class I adenylate-forming enzyme family protein n=1 Tax=uncultured Mycobacterium sp. TaxID=171292 RepID=UPI0035C9D18D
MRFWCGVEQGARLFGKRRFLFDTHGRSLTFREFRDHAESAAAGLVKLGIGRGTRVSWQLPTGLEAAVLIAAFSRIGAVQNPIIMSLREAELRTVARQFRPEFVFTPTVWRGFSHQAMAEALFPNAKIFCTDVPLGNSIEVALPRAERSCLEPLPLQDAPRWVYLTSGSSNEPKAVKHTDESVWASSNTMSKDLPFEADDVFPIAFPIAHIGGAAVMITALRIGFSVQLVDVFDPEKTPLEMAAAGATILGSATLFFNAYLAAQRQHGTARLFPRLRFCSGGGAPIGRGMDERVRTELGAAGLVNGYGLTECPMVGFPPLHDDDMRKRSAWMPGPGVQVRIVNRDGVDVPAGAEGELRLRAPQMFSGYLDSSQNADAFDESGFLRTGDLAIQGTYGEVVVTGRLKEIVIRKGENISLLEVEDVLIKHPSIVDVAVVGLPDQDRGERCCAAVVLADNSPIPTLHELRAFCRAHGLAPFKTPEQLVAVTDIPRTSMGKIQRIRLREEILAITSAERNE